MICKYHYKQSFELLVPVSTVNISVLKQRQGPYNLLYPHINLDIKIQAAKCGIRRYINFLVPTECPPFP
jgi:hypothetical protein